MPVIRVVEYKNKCDECGKISSENTGGNQMFKSKTSGNQPVYVIVTNGAVSGYICRECKIEYLRRAAEDLE